MSNRLRGRFPNRSSNRVPSWVLTAGGVPASLDIDFVNDRAYSASPTSIASLLSCTRASSGYYTNADGTLTQFSDNTLRYGTNGLLVEESRTNYFTNSEDFTGTAKTALTVTADQAIAPNGLLTADKIVTTAATSDHWLRNGTQSATDSLFSCYFKAAEYSKVGLFSVGTANRGVAFDLSNGSVNTTVMGVAPSVYGIQALANGWYRCWIANAGATDFRIYVLKDFVSSSYTGDGTSGIYAWGGQIEYVLTFPTSYIPTTSASATRSADAVSMATSAFAWSDATGTAYWNGQSFAGSGTPAYWSCSDGTTNERHLVYRNTNTDYFIADGGVSQANITTTGTPFSGACKHAVAYAANDIATTFGGGTVGTDASATLPTCTTLKLGADQGGSSLLNGYILRFAYWNSRISNANLQTLTA